MRIPRSLSTVVPVLALASAGLATSLQGPTKLAEIPRAVPVRWGLVLQADEPIYSAGDTLDARVVIANGSAQDAGYWTLASGGNGCTYRLELLDESGNAVWEPGSIVGGVYSGPGCGFGSHPKVLAAGSEDVLRVAVPLVYQNGGGFGALGAPLPAGFYQLSVEVLHIGPVHPPATFGPGLTYSARVPIQIE